MRETQHVVSELTDASFPSCHGPCPCYYAPCHLCRDSDSYCFSVVWMLRLGRRGHQHLGPFSRKNGDARPCHDRCHLRNDVDGTTTIGDDNRRRDPCGRSRRPAWLVMDLVIPKLLSEDVQAMN